MKRQITGKLWFLAALFSMFIPFVHAGAQSDGRISGKVVGTIGWGGRDT